MFYHLKNNGGRTRYTRYYLSLVEIKEYNVMIDGQNFSDQPVKKNLITYDNIRKITTSQGDDHTTSCLLDYPYFENCYKMIAIDLIKQQALDADPKAMQQNNFTRNLNNKQQYFLLFKKLKKTVLDFSQGTVKVF